MKYVFIRRDKFWRPNGEGYTPILAEAAVYTDAALGHRTVLDEYDPNYEYLKPYALPLSKAPKVTNACTREYLIDLLPDWPSEVET
tara:strand:+ start:588 stop:845 length:258 start_codon:yes stop_codon:yes gene_type:complete